MAPVTLINAQVDPLLGDGSKMEAARKKANVQVDRLEYDMNSDLSLTAQPA